MRIYTAAVCVFGVTCAVHAQPVSTVPDRSEVTQFMQQGSLKAVDMNNDCGVSDLDVAMMVNQRLMQLYGKNMAVGDWDGDGVQTGADVLLAVEDIVRRTFGKTSGIPGPVGEDDVIATVMEVAEEDQAADLDFDGAIDVNDIWVSYSAMGIQINDEDLDLVSGQIFEYLSYIHEKGEAALMAAECAPSTHLEGVSNTWPPNHPSWWPPNHMKSSSQSYEPPPYPPPNHWNSVSDGHGPPPHDSSVSSSWPPNHLKSASDTWPPPHGTWASLGGSDPNHHMEATSSQWPAGHTKDASATWPKNHDSGISRTWWPRHTQSDSSGHIVPPMHAKEVSNGWQHATATSRAQWPPNHYPPVSDGWGPGHSMKTSSAFPPGHVVDASNGWPGPQPSWPPNHTSTVSRSWGEPAPGDWPIFPPGHSWFATFQQVISPIAPRIPWPE